jgi:hypothetical protein
MRKYLICLLIIATIAVWGGKTYAQEIPKELYSAAGIPDSLKEDANSVVRYSMEDVTIKGPGKKVDKVHTVVTILNEKGNSEAEMVLPYNRKFDIVSSFEMLVYDATGKLIKKYHKSDMYERAAEEEDILVTDDRIMAIAHTVASYPTTIEMIYEVNHNSLIGLGSWDIQGEEQSIQNSYYRLSIASDAGFRYLDKNISIKPIKSTLDNTDIYAWKVSNMKAVKLEDGAMAWRVMPKIEMLANKFEFYGYPGDLSSWQSYGKWQQTLNADVSNLSPERIAEIQKMTADIKTDKGKAKFLYEYMQQSMRYVAITLGIGGDKPFPAAFVDQKKYGDCKALSNYMVALLKAVNIPAYYAEVRAGENEEPNDPSFTYDLTNHIIVCVPFKGDTTWLECTSTTQQFGKLGPFTENRNALLITDDGGKLVNTPKSTAQDNQFNSEVHIVLDSVGGAKSSIKMLNTGGYREMFIEAFEPRKLDEQKEGMIRYFNIKQPSAFDLKYSDDKDSVKTVNMELEYDKFCDIAAGNKLFYHPHAFDLCNVTVPILEKRKSDYYFDFPSINTCVTTIDLPANYEVEALPANQSLKFTCGNYEVNYAYNAAKNQVISTAKFNLLNHVIPAAKYNEMQQYLDAVAKAQNKKLVIRHKA